MFKQEGNYPVTVTDAYICECKFEAKPGELNDRGEPVQCFYDIVLVLTAESGENDYWKGEISNRSGKGNSADKYRSDLTLKTLQDIGFGVTTIAELEAQFYPNADGTVGIPNIIGLKGTAAVEAREWQGKMYYSVKYLNGASSVKKLTMDDLRARRAAAASVQTPAPAPAAPAAVVPAAPAAPVAPVAPPKPPCPYN